MAGIGFDSRKIEKNGWKQGACLLVDESAVVHTITQCMQEKLPVGIYIVLSQDCDVLNGSLEKEHYVELIAAVKLQKGVGDLITGKNPRKLHLELDQDSCCLEVLPNNRFFIDRTCLLSRKADQIKVATRSIKILVNWVAKRYKRPAFPDAFNKRIDSKTIKKVRRILSGDVVKKTRGLYIRLSSEDDLSDDETYKVFLKLLVPKKIYEDGDKVSEIEGGFNEICMLLENVDGIHIEDGSIVQSEDEITVHQYLKLKSWDFDYISFSNGECGDTVGDLDS